MSRAHSRREMTDTDTSFPLAGSATWLSYCSCTAQWHARCTLHLISVGRTPVQTQSSGANDMPVAGVSGLRLPICHLLLQHGRRSPTVMGLPHGTAHVVLDGLPPYNGTGLYV